VDFYNANKGFSYNTTFGNGDCGLLLVEGFLKYPANDVANADDVILADDSGSVSCGADNEVGTNGFVATMAAQGCGLYDGHIFTPPVPSTFFSSNFFTTPSTCEFYVGDSSFALFVRNSTYICCGYYNLLAKFESNFCIEEGMYCPSVSNFAFVGNFSVSSCDECCNGK